MTIAPQDRLRGISRAVIACGATTCVALTVYVGRRNKSVILMALFVGWVLAPFVAFAWAEMKSKSQALPAQAMLRRAIIALTLGASGIYGYTAFGPPVTKAAAPFLFVPAISLLVFGIAVLMASRQR